MRKQFLIPPLGFLLLVLLGSATTVCAQTAGPDQIQVTITASAPSGATLPALGREDVVVHQDGRPQQVLELIPSSDPKASLQLAILVDDGLNSELGTQFSDLHQFIHSLPASGQVEIAYAANGRALVLQGFTSDHDLAAKALRLPVGESQAQMGIYFAVSDLIKNWPAGAARREILLISDGIDLSYGVAESAPSMNLALAQAHNAAQRNNITVYSLFASGATMLSHNPYLILNGQGCLSQLAIETGGDAFFLGDRTPVAFQPFLQQVTKFLGQQYLLTFRATLPPRAGFHKLQVSTEIPHVEILAPSRVYLPAAK
jgi:VWFA-related protein